MTWALQGHGVQDWAFVTELTQGLTCAWADLTGFHVGKCPAEPPPYTHLWAWTSDASMLVRVRLDGGSAIVGTLTTGAGRPDAALAEVGVPVRVEQARTWAQADLRIGPQPDEVLPGSVTTFTVLTPMPITFVGPSGEA